MKSIAASLGVFVALLSSATGTAQTIDLTLRHQAPTSLNAKTYHRLDREESWSSNETAVIVCDMWDSHHCVNAVRRVAQLAPRIDAFCNALRNQGVTIIHAPSSCVDSYQLHPARLRSQAVPMADAFPKDIDSWCDQIPSEEVAAYPLDQSEGGEDDDLVDHRLWAERLESIGRNPRAPWLRQTDVIQIDEQRDYISDNGSEIWSILNHRKIKNVILVGVHTNMCVLGRPFGLRRMAAAGKNVVLARDLTDTMYDYRAWPYVSHFTGTDLIVDHVERFVCPTITSDQVLGGDAFRFAKDSRLRLVMLIAEDEYETAKTLPAFAAKHLGKSFSVSYAFADADERHHIVGIDQVANADALLVSVRRRALAPDDMRIIRSFVSQAKPVIGIRTASHAFSLRGKEPPEGKVVWETFDGDVFGGNYTNHYGNSLASTLTADDPVSHAILSATNVASIQPGGSLYKTAPLAPGANVLISGAVPNKDPEPVAWTFIRNDGGRSFYTSMGHKNDFAQAEFEALLAAGIHWACDLTPQSLDMIRGQNERYAAGGGKQRK